MKIKYYFSNRLLLFMAAAVIFVFWIILSVARPQA